jgi:hypothetical protein
MQLSPVRCMQITGGHIALQLGSYRVLNSLAADCPSVAARQRKIGRSPLPPRCMTRAVAVDTVPPGGNLTVHLAAAASAAQQRS